MTGSDTHEDTANILHRMAMEDPIPWYRKSNLRTLYLLLFPCVIGIEMTSGFDSQIINAVQIVPAWKLCTCDSIRRERKKHPPSPVAKRMPSPC